MSDEPPTFKLSACSCNEEQGPYDEPCRLCDEAHFIECLQDGLQEAWDILLLEWSLEVRKNIIASMRARGLPESLLEDIQGEVWERTMDKIGRFSIRSGLDKLKHWIRVISLNVVHEAVRKFQKDLSELSLDDEAVQKKVNFRTDLVLNAEQTFITQEEKSLLIRVFHSRSQEDQHIILRVYVGGEKAVSLAKEYCCTEAAIYQKLHRFKTDVRREWRRNGYFSPGETWKKRSHDSGEQGESNG